jgi:hypothetical protein
VFDDGFAARKKVKDLKLQKEEGAKELAQREETKRRLEKTRAFLSEQHQLSRLRNENQANAAEAVGEMDKADAGDPCEVYIFGLSWSVTEDHVRKFFKLHCIGELDEDSVSEVDLVSCPSTGRALGAAYVTFKSRELALGALKLDAPPNNNNNNNRSGGYQSQPRPRAEIGGRQVRMQPAGGPEEKERRQAARLERIQRQKTVEEEAEKAVLAAASRGRRLIFQPQEDADARSVSAAPAISGGESGEGGGGGLADDTVTDTSESGGGDSGGGESSGGGGGGGGNPLADAMRCLGLSPHNQAAVQQLVVQTVVDRLLLRANPGLKEQFAEAERAKGEALEVPVSKGGLVSAGGRADRPAGG